jgi:hypothetical protein
MGNKLRLLALILFAVPSLHAANCALSGGGDITSALGTASYAAATQTCTGTSSSSLVTIAAGSYIIYSQVGLSCPNSSTGYTISGPVVALARYTNGDGTTHYGYTPTATLSSSGAAQAGQMLSVPYACTNPITIQYLEFNGGQPSPNGGGTAVDVGEGVSNFTFAYNYAHGNQANVNDSSLSDILLYFEGSQNGLTDNNNQVLWNRFGATNDCSNIMSGEQYQGGSESNGGSCNAIGTYGDSNNFTIANNVIYYQEQGIKGYEGGCVKASYNSCNGTSVDLFALNNRQIIYNDFSTIHRIGIESQQSPITSTIGWNSFHDAYLAGLGTNNGSWIISVPEDGTYLVASPPSGDTLQSNLFLSNTTSGNAGPYALAGPSIELWGSATFHNNLSQGYADCGMQWGFYGSPGQIISNIMQMYNAANSSQAYTCNEESVAIYPAGSVQAGTFASYNYGAPTVGGTLTSQSPTISPNGGTLSTSQVVTLTDPGWTANTAIPGYPTGYGPQGNTGIWYTTDGSTPVPGSGTAQRVDSGGTVTITNTTTIKAVGMWGAANQPASYAPGYGFSPSSVVTAVFTGTVGAKPTPTLASISLGSTTNSVVVGGTLQIAATGVYSDGSSAPLSSSAVSWSSSNSGIFSISGSGLVTAIAAGVANVSATVGSVSSTPWPVTVSAAPSGTGSGTVSTLTLTGAYLNATANTLVAGSTLQFSAIGVYSDGSTATIPNSAVNWITNNSAVMTVNTSGVVTGTGAGVANVQAMIGSQYSSPWTVTVSAAPVVAPVPAAPGSPVGDTFLGPFWKTMTPVGGSTSMSNGHLFLNVPGGANHDTLLPSNEAVRMVQAVGNDNFDVSIKIDSTILATDAGTSQGLMVLSNGNDFLTFGIAPDGTNIHLVVETVISGAANKAFDDTNFSQYQTPIYLRLTRNNSAYVAFYSVDGINWEQAASFTDAKIPTAIGPYASNYNATPANAVPVVMAVEAFDVQ